MFTLPSLAVLLSSVAFALATVFVKHAALAGLSSASIVFGRFSLGSVLLGLWLAAQRKKLRIQRWDLVLGRAVTNVVAVWLFYEAVVYAGVTKANVYNMTYPISVAALGALFLGERTGLEKWVAIGISMVGVILIVDPIWSTPGYGDWVGLACGAMAGVTVLVLRKARATEDVAAIVLMLMASGTVMTLPFLKDSIPGIFTGPAAVPLLLASALGVLGQILFTYGTKYMNAVDFSVLSSTRMIFGAVFGVAFAGDVLTVAMFAGAALVTYGIYLVARANRS